MAGSLRSGTPGRVAPPCGTGHRGRMPIVPDTKDWTWVLDEQCPECGYAAAAVDARDLPELVRRNARSWAAVLATGSADLTRRPDDATWSPTEYGCHVRDVFRLFDARLELMLTQDAPLFANWDQDVTAEQERYGEQDPAVVGPELVAAAEAIAERFAAVTGTQWQRTGIRSDGARFTVDSFGRYFLHDVVHHLHDVGAA